MLPMSLGQTAYYGNKNIYDYIIVFMEFAVMFISAYIFSFGTKFLLNNRNKMYISPEEVVSLSRAKLAWHIMVYSFWMSYQSFKEGY